MLYAFGERRNVRSIRENLWLPTAKHNMFRPKQLAGFVAGLECDQVQELDFREVCEAAREDSVSEQDICETAAPEPADRGAIRRANGRYSNKDRKNVECVGRAHHDLALWHIHYRAAPSVAVVPNQ